MPSVNLVCKNKLDFLFILLSLPRLNQPSVYNKKRQLRLFANPALANNNHPSSLVHSMRTMIITTVLAILLIGCNDPKPAMKATAEEAPRVYPTVSYLDIKLDSNGHLPDNPYILEWSNSPKQIVFCGVNHLTDNRDTANPMFKKIEEKFFAFKPDVAVNEGGDLSHKRYASKSNALLTDSEIGLTRILCDSLKIKPVNGDPTTRIEFQELLKRYSKGDFLSYIVTERLMWGLKGQHITDSSAMIRSYDGFLQDYIVREGGIGLTKNEQAFEFYKTNYERLLGRPFNLATLEPTNPFEPNSKFQEIGRASKEIRDQYLLQTIDHLLDTYNKVFIVFGGWHLLTCQAGLEEIIKRSRK